MPTQSGIVAAGADIRELQVELPAASLEQVAETVVSLQSLGDGRDVPIPPVRSVQMADDGGDDGPELAAASLLLWLGESELGHGDVHLKGRDVDVDSGAKRRRE